MRARGTTCLIINLSLGDWGYRFGLGAQNYWGRLSKWSDYLSRFVDQHQITDIVYYADQRPYHRIAYGIAREKQLNAYAYEFGYLRPDWITLERGGMGVYSHFPDDPDMIRALAQTFDWRKPAGHYPYPFAAEAFNEVAYNFVPELFPYLFPFYQNDRYYHPFRDYLSYLPRLMKSSSNERLAQEMSGRLIKSGKPYFVVPMQMQNDYQVRHHSAYGHLSEMVTEVIESFVEHAASDARLLFKLHPLDNNIEKWPRVIRRVADEFGCSDRIFVIDGGNLAGLYRSASGVILVNSTAGLEALTMGVPVKVLGIAVYDVEGLTCRKPLDQFWKEPTVPDAELCQDFFKLLAASIQVKGNFFTKVGKKVAVPEFARRLIEGSVNCFGAYVETPPRLAKARQIGVPIPGNSYWNDR